MTTIDDEHVRRAETEAESARRALADTPDERLAADLGHTNAVKELSNLVLMERDVALVGGSRIARSEFDQVLAQARKTYVQQKRRFPSPGTREYDALKNQFVQYLVQREQFEQEGEQLGVKVTGEQVERRLRELKKQSGFEALGARPCRAWDLPAVERQVRRLCDDRGEAAPADG